MSNGIYQAIATAMSEIEPIAKNKRNKEQNFQYRGIDDIMNELSPILVKNKIFIYPEVIDVKRQERTTQKGGTLLYSVLTIKYHFAYEDGSELCCVVIGEGMDSGDKASNKAMAIAFKYACLQMFCIPTCDIDDPDANTLPNSMPANGNQQTPPKTNNQNPQDNKKKMAIGNEIKEILDAKNPDEQPYFKDVEISQERRNFVSGNLQAAEKQLERLKKYLETRKANFKSSIPYSDEHLEFQDDIPF